MKKSKKGMFAGLKLLNPKNLGKEVHVYGYHFSWKVHVLFILCSLLGISAIGIIFRLNPGEFSSIIIAVMVLLPMLILDMYRRMFEQKRFGDAVTYMEQMLYSFQKEGKIISALRETGELFEGGQMKEKIQEAIAYLERGKAATHQGVLREALGIVEVPYQCAKIHTVHELLASSEDHGGNMDQSVLIVLNDIEGWKRSGYKLQAEKKKSQMDNIISIIVATVLCAVALYVLNAMADLFPGTSTVEIFQVGIIQVSSMLFILFMLYVLRKIFKSMASNWLREEGTRGSEYIMKSYQTVIKYDDEKERRKSLIFSAPFLIAAVLAFVFGYPIAGVPCILLAVFMLFQHRLGYSLARKDVNNEMYIALPQWLMEMALLLQNNNVQVSLAKSIAGAPAVMKPELEHLMERLAQNPDSLRSYTDFCKDFDVPEAQSCMKMLHSISESGTGNAKVQIENLLTRVNEMQEMADQIRNRSNAFRTKMIFSYPILGASIKLLIDLTIGMVFMFQMMGSMGGTA